MQSEESGSTGRQATDRAEHYIPETIWQPPELSETMGKLNETAQNASATAVRALWNCYADLLKEVKAGLHSLYESTISELRLASREAMRMPRAGDERNVPGSGQIPGADDGDPFREYGMPVPLNSRHISLN